MPSLRRVASRPWYASGGGLRCAGRALRTAPAMAGRTAPGGSLGDRSGRPAESLSVWTPEADEADMGHRASRRLDLLRRLGARTRLWTLRAGSSGRSADRRIGVPRGTRTTREKRPRTNAVGLYSLSRRGDSRSRMRCGRGPRCAEHAARHGQCGNDRAWGGSRVRRSTIPVTRAASLHAGTRRWRCAVRQASDIGKGSRVLDL
mmetsp:Transcript_1010/g.2614  ORF Transcript_1010/g.2614 Transcript_1010/m.2614 type:complete len:204 (-) Transcript_1010:166-777(-)